MNIHEIRYIRFIESRKSRILSPETYVEKHHILPKSLGGSDDPLNIIELTAREHFIAHLILWKAYGGKLTTAFWYMQKHNPHYRKGVWISSRQFESLRKDEAEEQRKRVSGENHPGFGKPSPLRGRKQDPEHIRKRFSKPRPPMSEKQRKSISEHVRERFKNPENHPRYGKGIPKDLLERMLEGRRKKRLERNSVQNNLLKKDY